MRILNLTQHAAAPEQIAAGVVEPADKAAVQRLLTFEEPPTFSDICTRAKTLAEIAIASGFATAMIGGAPFLMGPLERCLRGYAGVKPLYSFSRREVVETVQEGG